ASALIFKSKRLNPHPPTRIFVMQDLTLNPLIVTLSKIRTGSSADLIVPCSTRDETHSSSLPDESVQKMFAPPLILPFNSAHLIESAKNSTDVSLGHSLIRRISEAKQKPIVSTTRKRSTTKGDRHGQTCYSLGAVIEGSGETVGLLREGLRLEDSALSGNELPRRRNR